MFICEKCGKIYSISEETSLYSDPVVVPPDGWGYDDEDAFSCYECLSEIRANPMKE
jgi:hypothetical protein